MSLFCLVPQAPGAGVRPLGLRAHVGTGPQWASRAAGQPSVCLVPQAPGRGRPPAWLTCPRGHGPSMGQSGRYNGPSGSGLRYRREKTKKQKNKNKNKIKTNKQKREFIMGSGPNDRLPSLKAIRCFEVAARHGSFTLAAAELHVTQGAVSRLIQSLEEDLGTPLFDRQGRTLRLTATGARPTPSRCAARWSRSPPHPAPSAAPMTAGWCASTCCPPSPCAGWCRACTASGPAARIILVDVTSSEAVIDFRTDPVDVAVRNGLCPVADRHRPPADGRGCRAVLRPGHWPLPCP